MDSFDFSQSDMGTSGQYARRNPEDSVASHSGTDYVNETAGHLTNNDATEWYENPIYYPPDASAVFSHDLDVNDPEDEEQMDQKPMSDFAHQRFKRSKHSAGTGKRQKTGLNSSGREGEEEAGETAELDEVEADEFFSQLIQPTTTADGNDHNGSVVDENGRRSITKKRPRWHPEESEFFRQCAALFDCNYVMIQDFLPHRTVSDLKKQYDKQRIQYASLYASFGTTARFETVAEYHVLKANLEAAKLKLDESMRDQSIKPWATASSAKSKKTMDVDEEEDEDDTVQNENDDDQDDLPADPIDEADGQ